MFRIATMSSEGDKNPKTKQNIGKQRKGRSKQLECLTMDGKDSALGRVKSRADPPDNTGDIPKLAFYVER